MRDRTLFIKCKPLRSTCQQQLCHVIKIINFDRFTIHAEILRIIGNAICIPSKKPVFALLELAKKHPVKEPKVDPAKLHWTPYITDVKRDKFSIHSKKPSVEGELNRDKGGF